jgi:hypothetical protein
MPNSQRYLIAWIGMLLSTNLLAVEKTATGETVDEIYRRVFGGKETLATDMEADLTIAKRSQGQIHVQTDGENITQMQRETLLANLEAYLKPDIYRKLEQISVGREWLAREQ